MLSEAETSRFSLSMRSSDNQSEIESLASRTSSAALQLRFAQNDICETGKVLFSRDSFNLRINQNSYGTDAG